MNLIIAKILMYSLQPTKWDFNNLTYDEKNIIENQANLDEIHRMVIDEFEYCGEGES